jgi:hypothetical protein
MLQKFCKSRREKVPPTPHFLYVFCSWNTAFGSSVVWLSTEHIPGIPRAVTSLLWNSRELFHLAEGQQCQVASMLLEVSLLKADEYLCRGFCFSVLPSHQCQVISLGSIPRGGFIELKTVKTFEVFITYWQNDFQKSLCPFTLPPARVSVPLCSWALPSH